MRQELIEATARELCRIGGIDPASWRALAPEVEQIYQVVLAIAVTTDAERKGKDKP